MVTRFYLARKCGLAQLHSTKTHRTYEHDFCGLYYDHVTESTCTLLDYSTKSHFLYRHPPFRFLRRQQSQRFGIFSNTWNTIFGMDKPTDSRDLVQVYFCVLLILTWKLIYRRRLLLPMLGTPYPTNDLPLLLKVKTRGLQIANCATVLSHFPVAPRLGFSTLKSPIYYAKVAQSVIRC